MKMTKAQLNRKALIIGGGIAGIQAALKIADAGFPVVLVEKKPTIGGHMAQLAEIFPAMNDAIDFLTPLMSKVGSHPNIRLLTLSEVVDVKGHLGDFHVQIKRNPRCVDPDKCDLCSDLGGAKCVETCPITVVSEFDEGLTLRKAIYLPFPHAVPSSYTIDKDVCISCGKCAQPEVCGPGAVNLADKEEFIEEKVAVVIVATGYELYGQGSIKEYRIDEYPDVVTSLQFERMLSRRGPTGGMPRRLSDGKIPKTIAFIHRAWSRSGEPMPSCGDICCAYLAKQAILFKRRVPDGKVYSLYVDLTTAKETYESLIKRAREEPEVNYIQADVSKIHEQNGKVKVLFTEKTQASKSVEIEVDMAVLALPMVAFPNIKELAEKMQIKTNEYWFLQKARSKTPPAESSTQGVFIVGCARTPMDIQSTLTDAKIVAEKVLELLS
jgi:heterodisulfide reductase subunit A